MEIHISPSNSSNVSHQSMLELSQTKKERTMFTYRGFGGSLANKVPSFLTPLPLSSGSESVSLSTI